MKLVIENIGKIKKAEFDFRGITVIAGNNNTGKSTVGKVLYSFVPCESATLPIIDKIFTRIGASDDLVSGESTFMVEMKEARNAICNATKNSLILFDECWKVTAS